MSVADASGTPLGVQVVRGAPTEEELAALVAVVTEEYACQELTATAVERPARSVWEITARGLRAPLRRDVGWGRFTG